MRLYRTTIRAHEHAPAEHLPLVRQQAGDEPADLLLQLHFYTRVTRGH